MIVAEHSLTQFLALPLLQLKTMLGTHADFRWAAKAVSGKFSLVALTWWLLSGRGSTSILSKVPDRPLETFGDEPCM